MPVQAKVVPTLSLVYVQYLGKVSVYEAQEALNKAFSSPEYSIDMDKIADLTQVTELDAGFSEVLEFAKETSKQYEPNSSSTKLCIVANNTVSRNAAELFANLAASVDHPGDIQILPGFPEVLTILDLPNDAFQLLPAECRAEAHLLTGLP